MAYCECERWKHHAIGWCHTAFWPARYGDQRDYDVMSLGRGLWGSDILVREMRYCPFCSAELRKKYPKQVRDKMSPTGSAADDDDDYGMSAGGEQYAACRYDCALAPPRERGKVAND